MSTINCVEVSKQNIAICLAKHHPQRSIGLPDVHSGYGFAIGNMAAFDMSDPTAVVSPGTGLTAMGVAPSSNVTHTHTHSTCDLRLVW